MMGGTYSHVDSPYERRSFVLTDLVRRVAGPPPGYSDVGSSDGFRGVFSDSGYATNLRHVLRGHLDR